MHDYDFQHPIPAEAEQPAEQDQPVDNVPSTAALVTGLSEPAAAPTAEEAEQLANEAASIGHNNPPDPYAMDFDFESLQPGVRDDVRADCIAVLAELRHMKQSKFEIGRRVSRIKKSVMHGKYMEIIQKVFGFSQSTANRYMDVYEVCSREEFVSLQNLSMKAETLYAFCKTSTKDVVRYELMDALASGEIKKDVIDEEFKKRMEAAKHPGGLMPPTKADKAFAREMEQREAAIRATRWIKSRCHPTDAEITDFTKDVGIAGLKEFSAALRARRISSYGFGFVTRDVPISGATGLPFSDEELAEDQLARAATPPPPQGPPNQPPGEPPQEPPEEPGEEQGPPQAWELAHDEAWDERITAERRAKLAEYRAQHMTAYRIHPQHEDTIFFKPPRSWRWYSEVLVPKQPIKDAGAAQPAAEAVTDSEQQQPVADAVLPVADADVVLPVADAEGDSPLA
jgi:hypothetical protein